MREKEFLEKNSGANCLKRINEEYESEIRFRGKMNPKCCIARPDPKCVCNMAEIELNVLIKQCFDRRIDNLDEMHTELVAWQNRRDNAHSRIDWQFTTDDARIKLNRLYPTLVT